MEIAIRVVVVLFIAIIVAGSIIVFTKNTLYKANNKITDMTKTQNEDNIIRVDTISENSIVGLADSCYKKNLGTFKENNCFGVFTKNSVGNLDFSSYDLSFRINDSTLSPNAKSFLIMYDVDENGLPVIKIE